MKPQWAPGRLGRKPARESGFTLVELMVALTGSLFFTIFVFMLSRDVGRYFQAQSRTSDTTLTTLTAFERLRADVARAGFMASPNLARDANRCPRPTPGGTAVAPQQVNTDFNAFPGLQQMAVLGIDDSPNSLTSLDFYDTYNNGTIAPDVLTLYGNYASAEQFPVRAIDFSSNPVTITLEQDSPALIRVGIRTIGATPTTDAEGTATLSRIFRAGTILRVTDETGREQYAIINGSSYASGLGTITIENLPNLQQKASGNTCGIRGHATGLAVNPVNIIRYQIVQVKPTVTTNHPQLSFLYQGAAPAYDDTTRLDLMRYEVPPNLARAATLTEVNWPGTTTRITAMGELVAEYAVDLAFGLTVLSDYQTGELTTLGEDDDLSDYSGNPLDAAEAGAAVLVDDTSGPHFIRGVHMRLSVRYREADRDIAILPNPADPSVAADQVLRVKVSDGNEFARTRTLRGYVTTRNTRNVTWN